MREKDQLVTKGYLEERFVKFEKFFKQTLITDLIKEERKMLHEALMESLENSKVYHQAETNRYIKAVMEEYREESKAFHNYMKGIKNTSENHEERISKLEWAVN